MTGVQTCALPISYVTLGGLGRFIYDGLAQQDYPQMISGGVLVAALALLTDLVLAMIQRYTVSRGLTRRYSTKTAGAQVEAVLQEAEVADR